MKQIIATKGNLITAKKQLQLSKLGYDLMNRKKEVLISEMMTLLTQVKQLRTIVTNSFKKAYTLFEEANMTLGVINRISNLAKLDCQINVVYRSVMGVEIPKIDYKPEPIKIIYGFEETNSRLDEAYVELVELKKVIAILAQIDHSVFRLAKAIQVTQKRTNALKNIVIPQKEAEIKYIYDALEEKEREEFIRMKMIKFKKTNK